MEYEYSVESYELVASETAEGGYKQVYVFSSDDESNKGNLITMNIDLGPQRNGNKILQALDNENPEQIAKEFS